MEGNQFRPIDHLTALQIEARQKLGRAPVKRRERNSPVPFTLPLKGSEGRKIIENSIKYLNNAIAGYSEDIVARSNSMLSFSRRSETTRRARAVLGDLLVDIIHKQAMRSEIRGFSTIMPMILKMFMVTWTSDVIEGFYPRRRTFSDLLAIMKTLPPRWERDRHELCPELIPVISSFSDKNYQAWAQEMFDDLCTILAVWGLTVKDQWEDHFKSCFETLLKEAYRTRISLAEKDLCGNLELLVIPSDAPFQSRFMIPGYPTTRFREENLAPKDVVVGTIGLGLLKTKDWDGVTELNPPVAILRPTVIKAGELSSFTS